MSDPMVQDVSRSYELYVTISVCLFAVVATTVLRIGTKLIYRLSLRWDDYFMILGTVRHPSCDRFRSDLSDLRGSQSFSVSTLLPTLLITNLQHQALAATPAS